MLKKVIINKDSGNILCEKARVRQNVNTDVLKTVKKNQVMVWDGDVVINSCLSVDGTIEGGTVENPIIVGGPIAPTLLTNFSGLIGACGVPNSSIMYNVDDTAHEKFIQYNVTTGRRSGDFFQVPPAATGAYQVCWAQGPGPKQVSRLMYVSGTNYIATYDIPTGSTSIVTLPSVGGLNTMGFGTLAFDSIGNMWIAYMVDSGLSGDYIMLQIDPVLGTTSPSTSGFQSLGVYLGGMFKVGTRIVANVIDSPTFLDINAAGEILSNAPWEGNFVFEGDIMPWLQDMFDANEISFGNITYDSSSGKVYILLNQPIPMMTGGDFQPAAAIGWFYLSELQFASGAPTLGTPGPITFEKDLSLSPGNGENESLALNTNNGLFYRWTGYGTPDFAMHTIDINTLADGPNLYPGGDNQVDDRSASGVAFNAVEDLWYIFYHANLYTLASSGDPTTHVFIGNNPDATFGGIEFVNGVLYGIPRFDTNLYIIDHTDASTISTVPMTVLGSPDTIPEGGQGMSYNADLDMLFVLYKSEGDNYVRGVGIIDVITGNITDVIPPAGPYATIAFDQNNKLWLAQGIGGENRNLVSVEGLVEGGITPETFDIRILPKIPSENPHGIVYVD